jgi:hypothetical protein
MKPQTTVLRSQGTAAMAAAMEVGMTNRPNDDDMPLNPVMPRHLAVQSRNPSDLASMVACSGS